MQSSSNTSLPSIIVETCPHCEHPIPVISVEEEIQDGHCRVCKSALRPPSPVDHFEQEQTRVKELLERIPEQHLQRVREEHAEVQKRLQEVQQVQEQLRGELHDLPNQAQGSIELELRRLFLARLGYVQGQLESMQDYTEERLHERKRALESEAAILGAAHRQLRKMVFARNQKTIAELERLTHEFALEFNLPNLDDVLLREDLELLVVQSGRRNTVNTLSQSERLRLKIAFHLALLALRVKQGVGRHPAILIIDAPGGGEINDRNFGEILDGLNTIKKELGEDVQILIASARPALSQVCDPDKLTIVPRNEKLF